MTTLRTVAFWTKRSIQFLVLMAIASAFMFFASLKLVDMIVF